jgi:hypothetical protein
MKPFYFSSLIPHPSSLFILLLLAPGIKAQDAINLGVTAGGAFSSGNPALQSSAFFLEGQADVRLKGPLSLLLSAGSLFTSSRADRSFAIRLYTAGFALKWAIPVGSGRVKPFVAVGPTLLYFDPEGDVDSEEALTLVGYTITGGLGYPVAPRWRMVFQARLAMARTDVERFPLSAPRGSSGWSAQSGVGTGLFFRF